MEHAVGAEDPQPDVALQSHHGAHRELADVAEPRDVAATRLLGLESQRVHAPDLLDRVQPHQILADRRIVDRAGRLGEVDQHPAGAAELGAATDAALARDEVAGARS